MDRNIERMPDLNDSYRCRVWSVARFSGPQGQKDLLIIVFFGKIPRYGFESLFNYILLIFKNENNE